MVTLQHLLDVHASPSSAEPWQGLASSTDRARQWLDAAQAAGARAASHQRRPANRRCRRGSGGPGLPVSSANARRIRAPGCAPPPYPLTLVAEHRAARVPGLRARRRAGARPLNGTAMTAQKHSRAFVAASGSPTAAPLLKRRQAAHSPRRWSDPAPACRLPAPSTNGGRLQEFASDVTESLRGPWLERVVDPVTHGAPFEPSPSRAAPGGDARPSAGARRSR